MYKGIGVSSGISFAQVLVWHAPPPLTTAPSSAAEPRVELERFQKAHTALRSKIEGLRHKTARRFGDTEAAIFDAYNMMLSDDEGLIEPVRQNIIALKYTAEYSIILQFNSLARQFLELDSDYLRQRADDIYSLRDELLREIMGTASTDASHLTHPTIIVAHSLSPADIGNMDLSRVEGLICETGGWSSHTSIVARTLGIPAVVGASGLMQAAHNGDMIAFDGSTGEIWLEPAKQEIAALRTRSMQVEQQRREAQLLHGKPTITTDGHRVTLAANIGRLAELDAVLSCDAESIGMFRSERLHADRAPMANEEQQYMAYRCALEKMAGKSVTVRLFDDGGSWPILPVKGPVEEANPRLGFRGIRLALGRMGFLRTQLRALLRASAYGQLQLLLPMLSTPDELDEVLRVWAEVKLELARAHIDHDPGVPVGLLVEVPSTAILAAELAKKVDFFSVDVGDLTAFTLAIDRDNPALDYLYHPLHPSVLRLVAGTINAAHEQGIPCHICGEVPKQELALPLFLGMGADGFSMGPSMVLESRRLLNSCSHLDCYRLAEDVQKCNTAKSVAALLETFAATLKEKAREEATDPPSPEEQNTMAKAPVA